MGKTARPLLPLLHLVSHCWTCAAAVVATLPAVEGAFGNGVELKAYSDAAVAGWGWSCSPGVVCRRATQQLLLLPRPLLLHFVSFGGVVPVAAAAAVETDVGRWTWTSERASLYSCRCGSGGVLTGSEAVRFQFDS